MKARDLTGREFGRLIQVSDSYPSKLFAGHHRPDVDLLKQMAVLLVGDYEELAHLAGYRDRPSDASQFVGALRTLEESLDERAKDTILALASYEAHATAAERARQAPDPLRLPTQLPAASTGLTAEDERVMREAEGELAREAEQEREQPPAPRQAPRRRRVGEDTT